MTLADLAAIRYGLAEPECIAATAGGLAASATLSVASPAALTAVQSMLDEAARELPPEVQLARFDPADTLIELSLPSDVELRAGAELVGRGFSPTTPNWLVEVGGEGEVCRGEGLRVRLSVPGSSAANRGLLESLAQVPGVLDVEPRGDATTRRLWLLGPELEQLASIAARLVARLPGLDVELEPDHASMNIEADLDALARLGIPSAELERELQLAHGVTLTTWRDVEGGTIPVVLRSAGPSEADPDSLADLTVGRGEHAVPLTSVATLERRAGPARICRHDGQRGVMLAISTDRVAELERALAAELEPGYRWVWADD